MHTCFFIIELLGIYFTCILYRNDDLARLYIIFLFPDNTVKQIHLLVTKGPVVRICNILSRYIMPLLSTDTKIYQLSSFTTLKIFT